MSDLSFKDLGGMCITDGDHKAWWNFLVRKTDYPDSDAVEVRGKRVMTRSRELVCPHCGVTFYGYQYIDHPHPGGQVDSEPSNGFGSRQTCGDPRCWDAEDALQFKRRLEFRNTHKNAPTTTSPYSRKSRLG
jgi:hypothetical protein